MVFCHGYGLLISEIQNPITIVRSYFYLRAYLGHHVLFKHGKENVDAQIKLATRTPPHRLRQCSTTLVGHREQSVGDFLKLYNLNDECIPFHEVFRY
jgi:hypothetical protein